MKESIDKKIKKLVSERDAKINKITYDYGKKIDKITSSYRKDDSYGEYEMKFDLKKNVVCSDKWGFTRNAKSCNKWSKKSDWFQVEIEDYDTFTTYTDCGYGDYDEHAMFRVVKRYEVCPNCGRMIHIETKKFEHGKSKTRWEDSSGYDIRPLGWQPQVKVIGRRK